MKATSTALLCLALGCGLPATIGAVDAGSVALQARNVGFPEPQLLHRRQGSPSEDSGSKASAEPSPQPSSNNSNNNKPSASTKPTQTKGDDTASGTDSQATGSDSEDSENSEEEGDATDFGRVNMIIPPYPTGVATPRFELDNTNITFKWKYTNLINAPDAISITVSMPAPDGSQPLVYFDLATNVSADTTTIDWDTTQNRPATVALMESDKYTFMLYDSSLGYKQPQTNLGSLFQFTMKFAMYRSYYNDPNQCIQCLIKGDNYNAAPGLYANTVGSFVLASVTYLVVAALF
ncbi:hypothetical protein IWQ60_002091 [Tieghemiomyces parasiticus]|uniref:DUF7137 domain-containing protein n=1 Tax=Tieghemiomyces parasiticus TaxID=78921 RepID=A0A9W8AJJ5_9FUNG|nr:hypothetical protein IWQ60_002091 [Tieghemiomyces parasiticus]